MKRMEFNMLSTPDDLLPPEGGSEDEIFMREALLEAFKAWQMDEVPVGAVLVKDGVVIARSHNTRETSRRPTDHAELNVIEYAARLLDNWRLEGTRLYVTLEPCVMCAGAIIHARIPEVIWGADDPKAGACVSLYNLLQDERLNHRCSVRNGVLGEACSDVLKRYFKQKRTTQKAKNERSLPDGSL
jgi:tRNA(adenine34) deaminase